MKKESTRHVSQVLSDMLVQIRNNMYIAWYEIYKKHKGNITAISNETGYSIESVEKTLKSLSII